MDGGIGEDRQWRRSECKSTYLCGNVCGAEDAEELAAHGGVCWKRSTGQRRFTNAVECGSSMTCPRPLCRGEGIQRTSCSAPLPDSWRNSLSPSHLRPSTMRPSPHPHLSCDKRKQTPNPSNAGSRRLHVAPVRAVAHRPGPELIICYHAPRRIRSQSCWDGGTPTVADQRVVSSSAGEGRQCRQP